MVIEMIDGEPPYFNLYAKEAMTCLGIEDPPTPRNRVSNLLIAYLYINEPYVACSHVFGMYMHYSVDIGREGVFSMGPISLI